MNQNTWKPAIKAPTFDLLLQLRQNSRNKVLSAWSTGSRHFPEADADNCNWAGQAPWRLWETFNVWYFYPSFYSRA